MSVETNTISLIPIDRKLILRTLLIVTLLFTCFESHLFAQVSNPSPAPSKTPQIADSQDERETIPMRRKRRRTARPAEYQGAGVLQIEFGYEGDSSAKDQPSSQRLTLSLNFAVTDKLQVEFANDNFVTQTDDTNNRQSGIGNTSLGFQYTVQTEKKKRPAFAFAYQTTLPTASKVKGLSNGRPAHQLTGIMSKEVRETDINFNLSMLLNGRENQKNYDKGAQIALGFSRDLKKGYNFQSEIFGQTLDANEPKGVYVSSTLTYQKKNRWLLDIGTNIGLTTSAPRFGIFAGITFNAVNFYQAR